ncbi:MAG: HAMP domain-containing histidine kinase [Oscillospiraceae bacterium]|nr:HAMP domain-containing histidine kinase [Oscillospiraceae bacterium]
MRIKKTISKILGAYFGKELELRIQFFNLTAFVGIIAGVIVAVIGAISSFGATAVVIDLAITPMSYVMLRVAEKKKCYRLCSWLWVVLMFMIAFPALFFLCGGHKSGASCLFILAIVFTALLLDGGEGFAAAALEAVIYAACTIFAYVRPETLAVIESDFIYTLHALSNFLICAALSVLVVLIRNRMITAKQQEVEELNRELAARNETLVRYDQMKSDFLATMAHEINTPLAVIAASSGDTLDLLKETPINMEEITHNLMESERMVKLIDNVMLDLMDTVAIEKGRISLERQIVDMAELLSYVCDAQHKKLDANGNELGYELQEGLPKIWLDPTRIEQVMINLLSNAFRHTQNGTITVRLRREEDRQVVSVTDDGEGMDAETARVALRQYVSTKADHWRHGIGLCVCRHIIMAHGGEIWIESEKGEGTEIHFALNEGADYA